MKTEQAIILRRVDALYGAAAARFATYETVAHRAFCESLREAFPYADSLDAGLAFKYAIEKYGYLTPEQIADEDERNEDDGICRHGLDWMTCPSGCFEQ